MSLLLHQNRFGEMWHYITDSAMDPLQWMGAVRMRVKTADKNITIIHTTPVHQTPLTINPLTSWEVKSCIFGRNKCIIKTLFNFKLLLMYLMSTIHITAFFRENLFSSESGEKSAQIKHRLQPKTALNQYMGGFWCEGQQWIMFSLEEALLLIMDSYFSRK